LSRGGNGLVWLHARETSSHDQLTRNSSRDIPARLHIATACCECFVNVLKASGLRMRG